MRKTIGTVLAIGLCFAFAPVASAHVLKTDQGMGAVLHILPDDAPVANEPTTYELSFQSNQPGFELQNCDCKVELSANSKPVLQETLTVANTRVSRNTVTFPKPAVYAFRVTGTPKNGATFSAFTLDYTVRVGGAQTSQPIPPALWIGLGMAVVLLLLYANTQEYHGKTIPKEGK